MPAKVHPADEAAARIIARAQRFEITLFQGQGRYAKAEATTLPEAREVSPEHDGRRTRRPGQPAGP